MTVLDRLITDRERKDVDQARAILAKCWGYMSQAEKDAYVSGLKGAYGPTDMNRVREALEYIDRLMVNAKRSSVYTPVPIQHTEYSPEEGWQSWSDLITIPSDYVGPDIYFANINRLWEAARRFEAVALARYDPNGNGYISPDTVVDGGMMFTVTDSVGLLELKVTAVCPDSVTAEGAGWSVTVTDTGWESVLEYPTGPYPDINNALEGLKISCGADAVIDGAFTLSAVLRYDYGVTVGTCAVRWSPFITWGEARDKYHTWGGAKPLTWSEAARGGTA